jgi:hypothetical protein
VGGRPKPEHDTFEAFLDMERGRLQKHARGKLAEAIGHVLPGESQEDLDRIAREDRHLAQEGKVALKEGGEIRYKRVEDLNRENREASSSAEKEEAGWLMERVECRKRGRVRPHPRLPTLTFRVGGKAGVRRSLVRRRSEKEPSTQFGE